MTKCWRCGGGKTISMTTTGTHALPCPTCAGTGELSVAQEDDRKIAEVVPHPALEPFPAKPRAA
jgi:Zn finger protein HypA/HybF involved in hydrogenase expression